MNKRNPTIYLGLISTLFLAITGWYAFSFNTYSTTPETFDGERALADVEAQVAMGPRTPGSAGHAQVREWMRTELENTGWLVEVHEAERLGHPIYNIIAKKGGELPQIILAAHYDTRFFADHDPVETKRSEPVPGANDGASGVAVLLELARILPDDTVPVWLVFFDAEDNGRIEGWDWILGSRAFVEEIPVRPRAVIIVDMVGDADLNLYYERNSDVTLRAEIWKTAERLGYGDIFIPSEKHSMLDDHTPFLEKGIPAVDIIDFDYPYWHTTEDTADKVSADSLKAVGDTLWHWVVEQGGN
ncbi:MAG: M28 family peptidase [Chloroflexi bacterium]|nr:MAG: M28 family peptidase [Chloroflexota bacterium]